VFIAADGAATLLGVTRQLVGEDWLGAHGFQYAGSIGPLPVDDAMRATIERIGNVLAERFELVGLFGVDLIVNSDGVWTLEVNPRYTASVEIVERAAAVNAIEFHARAFRAYESARAGRSSAPIGGEDAPARSESRTCGKAILFAKREVVLSNDFAQFALTHALKTPWPTLADISPAGTLIESGRPILTIFAEGASVDDVEQQLRARVPELEKQIYGSEVPS
jgi:predicted ATP-grasp superfamily ATP-dependent carboligase